MVCGHSVVLLLIKCIGFEAKVIKEMRMLQINRGRLPTLEELPPVPEYAYVNCKVIPF